MNNNLIFDTINNYKKILLHLESHIKTGEADEQDYIQSNLIKKEIKKLLNKILIPVKDLSNNDKLYYISNPKKAQYNAFKYLGPSAVLYKSFKPDKKYKILNVYTNKYIDFGSNMQDYLYHRDKARQNNYLRRSGNIQGKWRDDPYSKNNLSRIILWNALK
jgi:hypothetical protein